MGRSLSSAVVEIRMTGRGGQVGERVSGSQEPRGGCSGQSRCFWKQTEEVEWWGQVHDLPNATNHHLWTPCSLAGEAEMSPGDWTWALPWRPSHQGQPLSYIPIRPAEAPGDGSRKCAKDSHDGRRDAERGTQVRAGYGTRVASKDQGAADAWAFAPCWAVSCGLCRWVSPIRVLVSTPGNRGRHNNLGFYK